jgi:fumarate hydratase class II
MATGRTVREVVVEKGYLTAEEADRLLDARRLTEGGIQQ